MSNQSQTLTDEEPQASNAALKAQVEYLAKQVAQLTKMKLKMMDTPEESDEEQEVDAHPMGDSNNTGGSSNEKGASGFMLEYVPFTRGGVNNQEHTQFLKKWL
ncbi:unnamed protein product [Cuscuta campestris]|uniref:Uncharacterized protein n=1 Tax=Cuscuta campestris TaxID=132261 RepID=A0A484M8Q7_9ASTE|nr:unnamed protein product [Cuscuta campestris]